MALSTLYERLEEVRVWSRTRETREEFIQEMKPVCPNVDRMIPVEKIENAVRGADIVVTTTPSRIPIISNDWISPGIHINCIGADAPGKQELDPAILKRAKIVVDDWDQASHSGEINVPLARGIISQKDVFGELGEIVAGLKKGRVSADEITVFIATGLAIEDAVTAKIAFKKALAQRIGHFIEFI
jgi:alanine dehydrogenase